MNSTEMYQVANKLDDTFWLLYAQHKSMVKGWQFDGTFTDKANIYASMVVSGWVYALMKQRNYWDRRADYAHVAETGF